MRPQLDMMTPMHVQRLRKYADKFLNVTQELVENAEHDEDKFEVNEIFDIAIC